MEGAPASSGFPPLDHIKDLVFEVPIDAVELTPTNNTTAQHWKDLLMSLMDRTILVNIQVARIPLKVELFNGDLAASPVPILFFSDRAVAFNGLMEHADTVLEDLGKLNSRFYFMEHLSMEEALTYLAGPAR